MYESYPGTTWNPDMFIDGRRYYRYALAYIIYTDKSRMLRTEVEQIYIIDRVDDLSEYGTDDEYVIEKIAEAEDLIFENGDGLIALYSLKYDDSHSLFVCGYQVFPDALRHTIHRTEYAFDVYDEKLSVDFDAQRIAIQQENDREIRKMTNALDEAFQNGSSYDDIFVHDEFSGKDFQDIKMKIENVCAVRDADPGELLAKIVSDEEIAMILFAKSESRCVWQEKYQFDVLSTQSFIGDDLRDLPNSSSNSISLPGSSKTVDFIGKVYDDNNKCLRTLYVCAKYTNRPGGSQDNQCDDLWGFASCGEALMETEPESIIILLADGPYYLRDGKHQVKNTQASNFFEAISLMNYPNVFATTTEQFDIDLS